ncbi:hypothetical protein D3H65_14820 [Paraflavitalea soli]|uniref:Uncharacterized protein n=1 Tax=Paraflavitalea soli TaxID=2315862 RepID=A0A3B7ML30_9BACT|nr:hypothetical protein D3H65_14820 [Paraflavitalea soli]
MVNAYEWEHPRLLLGGDFFLPHPNHLVNRKQFLSKNVDGFFRIKVITCNQAYHFFYRGTTSPAIYFSKNIIYLIKLIPTLVSSKKPVLPVW